MAAPSTNHLQQTQQHMAAQQVIPEQLQHPSARLQPMPISWQPAYAVPAAVPVVSVAGVGEKKPRPRKPYTTTKAREMWTPEEHSRMLEGLKRYKRDWAKVTAYVGTRSAAQVRSHAQKYFDRVQRDKTDDYVPQARPKRKSSSPYPRKMRPEQQQQAPATPTLHGPGSIPTTPQYYSMFPHMYPVEGYPGLPPGATILATAPSPQPHPGSSPYQYSIHPTMYGAGIPHPHHQQHVSPQPMAGHMHHVPHPHHPQFIMSHPAAMMATAAPPTSAAGSTGQQPPRPSPVISSPNPSQLVRVHHPGSIPVQPGTAVTYSPVPHGVRVARMMPQFAQPVPSPMSVDVSDRSYTAIPHGALPGVVVHPQQQHSTAMYAAAATPMSPLTPYPAVAVSPVPTTPISQGVRSSSMMQKQKTSYVPQHTHPNGPDPNCAKCNALKRYGNVFQELGAIRSTTAPPTISASAPVVEKGSAITKIDKTRRSAKIIAGHIDLDSDSTVKPGEGSSGSSTENNAKESRKDANAQNSQNVTGNISSKKKPPRSVLPPTSANGARSMKQQISFRRISKPYDASRPHHTVGPNGKKKTATSIVGDESPNAGASGDRIVTGSPSGGGGNGKTVSSIAKVLTTDREPTIAAVAAAAASVSVGTKRARSSDDEGKDENDNAKTARYSNTERREIFDAVKSLQILGSATPATGSPGPKN